MVRSLRTNRRAPSRLRLPLADLKRLSKPIHQVFTLEDIGRALGLTASQAPRALELLQSCLVLDKAMGQDGMVGYAINRWVWKLLDPDPGLDMNIDQVQFVLQSLLDTVRSFNRSAQLASVRSISFDGPLLTMEREGRIQAIDTHILVAAQPAPRVGLEVRDLVKSLMRTGARNVRLSVDLQEHR